MAFDPWVFVYKQAVIGAPAVAMQYQKPTSMHENAGLIAGLAQWLKDGVLL